MKRKQQSGFDYIVTPPDYPTMDSPDNLMYDTFIKLRDTIVYSSKYYAENAGRSLIIGIKNDGTPTGTIEIWQPNSVRLDFQPSGLVVPTVNGKYIEIGGQSGITCVIKNKGRYKIQHKEQFNNISSDITRIHCYVVEHKNDGTTQDRAVFDWERNTPGEILRLTSFSSVECDLDKGEWLELKLEDQGGNDIQSATASNSNRWMVEYIDLAYNI